MHPTIYDVAKLAGVSISTVSRVLNAPQKVNEKTRSAVITAIDQLGFVPSAESRSRALARSGRIGVLTTYFTLPSFVQRLRGVAAGLATTNYELVIYPVDSRQRMLGYLETLPISRRLDGLIGISLCLDDAITERLLRNALPTVLIEFRHRSMSSVEIDDFGGGKMAAEYLLNKGYRNFVFIGDVELPDYGVHPIPNRLAGFRQAVANAGIPFGDDRVFHVTPDLDATRRLTAEIIARFSPPVALFAALDLQAMGILKAARELGVRVPQDLAVIGFDDLDMAEYMGLTTICQHLDESGRVAVELLLSQIENANRPVRHIHLPLTIIERSSA